MTVKLHLAAILITATCTLPTIAQTVYKCGSTFSQVPCGVGQKEIEVKADDPCDSDANRSSSACIMRPYKPHKPSTTEKKQAERIEQQKETEDRVAKQEVARIKLLNPDTALVEGNKKLCVQKITYSLKDPDSAKFGSVLRLGADIDRNDGVATPSVWYSVSVNAKNSYGGYTGVKFHICVFSADEKSFIRAWST